MTTQKATSTAPSAKSAEVSTTNRKAWIKKTPVEIVLEQIGKQEEKVSGMRAELAREEKELAKLDKARQVLQAT